jgi:hypothetical protein
MRWQKLWQPALFPCVEGWYIRASNPPCGSHLQSINKYMTIYNASAEAWGGRSGTYLVEHARLQSVASFAVACEARVPYIVPLTIVADARIAWLYGQNLIVAGAH